MLTFFLTFITLLIFTTHGCVNLKGIGNGTDELEYINNGGIGAWFLPFLTYQEEVLLTLEPAVEFRVAFYNGLSQYQIAETYGDNYMEAFGRTDVDAARQRCITGVDSSIINQYMDVSIAYGFYFVSQVFYIPLGFNQDELDTFFESTVGYPSDICNTLGCDDPETPWGLAYMIVNENYEWSLTDGYNHDGSYNREFNNVPFEDWRDNPYVPSNDPWELKNDDLWQPLLESDGLGFLYNQEHVVPHIGFTGRYFYLSDEYACSRIVEDPDYDYEIEIDLLLDRMANLNDFKKGEIELYDVKVSSIIASTILFDIYQGLFPYNTEFWLNLFLVTDVSMESTQIVWRSKVLQNRIRPPSIIKQQRRDEDITTYAGTDLEGNSYGTQTFKGRDFESYVRTMPHAEYPSGSACLCEAITRYYRYVTGTNSIADVVGLTLDLTWAAGSSRREVNTPAADVLYQYSTWSDISYACGISRLNGGMHFTASINASNELCGDSGNVIGAVHDALMNGEVPDYVIDFNDPASQELVQDRCGDYDEDESESESEENEENEEGEGRNRRSSSTD